MFNSCIKNDCTPRDTGGGTPTDLGPINQRVDDNFSGDAINLSNDLLETSNRITIDNLLQGSINNVSAALTSEGEHA